MNIFDKLCASIGSALAVDRVMMISLMSEDIAALGQISNLKAAIERGYKHGLRCVDGPAAVEKVNYLCKKRLKSGGNVNP